MNDIPRSFIDIRNASVSYAAKTKPFGRLLGRKPLMHSALRDISLNIDKGQWITLFGTPGSGKSTFLRMLAGGVRQTRGMVRIAGREPKHTKHIAAGYVSSEESLARAEAVSEILHAFGRTHGVSNLPSRIGELVEILQIGNVLYRSVQGLSTVERLRVNIAIAALSESPIILLDDVADSMGPDTVLQIMNDVFEGRTVISSTRMPHIAEAMNLPLVMLHNARIAHQGTREEIAQQAGTSRVVEVWIEELRYDLLRKLRRHPGVYEVRLISNERFQGQRLRITLRSSRYLPAMYDMVSQSSLVKVEELPPSLVDVVRTLQA